MPNTPLKQSGKPWYVPESSTKKPKVDSNLEITIVRLDDITSVPIKSKLIMNTVAKLLVQQWQQMNFWVFVKDEFGESIVHQYLRVCKLMYAFLMFQVHHQICLK